MQPDHLKHFINPLRILLKQIQAEELNARRVRKLTRYQTSARAIPQTPPLEATR